MIILQFTGNGRGMLEGVKEYIMLFEDEADIRDKPTATITESIERKTAPGFKLAEQYDTDVDTDFHMLPTGRMLIAR